MCYIGFPTASISQKMKDILQTRKGGDWTKEYTEKKLRKFVKWGIRESKKYQGQCKNIELLFTI